MKRHNLFASSAMAALCVVAVPLHAQTTSPTTTDATGQATAETPAADPAQADGGAHGDIIVTGSARAQRRFDVSYAVNSLSQADVQKIAPKSFADLLGTVPGIQVEATGGEVQNVTRVRGIPTDRGYLIF